MAYNPPPTGHVVVILDNGTTAMTGLQEHPGTGKRLNQEAASKFDFEGLGKMLGINVRVVDPVAKTQELRQIIADSLESGKLELIIARRPCLLAAAKKKKEAANG